MSIPIESLRDAFRAAPFTTDGWDSALRLLASATGSSRGQLVAFNDRHARFNRVTDVPEEYPELFVSLEAYRPEVNYRVGAKGNIFEVTHEHHYDLSLQNYGTNEAYLDHVVNFEAEFGAQTLLLETQDVMLGLAIMRGKADGRTTDEQRATFAQVFPDVLAAVRLQNAIDHQGVALQSGTLDAVGVAAVLLDGYGNICAVTSAAEPILAQGRLLIKAKSLLASSPAFNRALQQAIGAALAFVPQPSVELWLPGSRPPVLVEVNPLPLRNWTMGYAPAVLVTLRSPLASDAVSGATLSDALGLTLAEGEVAALLAVGHNRRSIAALRGTSLQTVTAQLRNIFLKTDVHREAELVQLVSQIAYIANRR